MDALGGSHSVSTFGALSAAAPNTAFKFMVSEAGRLTAVPNAYASDSELNILSAPHILATNNKEAKIDVGEEVPILKTRTTPTAGDVTTTVTNDIP